MNLHTKAFYIIKNGILNLAAYCAGQRLVESAIEKENEGLDLLLSKDEKSVKKAAEPKKVADSKKNA